MQIEDLPQCLLREILGRLDAPELCTLASTCRKLNEVARKDLGESYWQNQSPPHPWSISQAEPSRILLGSARAPVSACLVFFRAPVSSHRRVGLNRIASAGQWHPIQSNPIQSKAKISLGGI